MTTNQAMADPPSVDAAAPAFAHGETAENPIPVPNAISARESAAVTNAPASTAGQETPDVYASFRPTSADALCSSRMCTEGIACGINALLSIYEKNITRGHRCPAWIAAAWSPRSFLV